MQPHTAKCIYAHCAIEAHLDSQRFPRISVLSVLDLCIAALHAQRECAATSLCKARIPSLAETLQLLRYRE